KRAFRLESPFTAAWPARKPGGAAIGARGLLLQDGCNGLGHVVDVAAVERCHADAAAGYGVNTVLFTQGVDLFLGETGIGEHAALLEDEAEILLDAVFLQFGDQLAAHVANAFTHAGQLLRPEL